MQGAYALKFWKVRQKMVVPQRVVRVTPKEEREVPLISKSVDSPRHCSDEADSFLDCASPARSQLTSV